jgi:hypothetical protein
MMHMKTIAAGTAIAGSLGLAALGLGAGVANAAPSSVQSGTAWAQDAGWGHGPGPGGPWGGPGWGGPGWVPPPPPPDYGYGYGVGYAPPCVTGPLGLLHLCV